MSTDVQECYLVTVWCPKHKVVLDTILLKAATLADVLQNFPGLKITIFRTKCP